MSTLRNDFRSLAWGFLFDLGVLRRHGIGRRLFEFVATDFLQVVVPVAKISLDPSRMNSCSNDIGVIAVDFGTEYLSTFANLLEAVGLTGFDFLLRTGKVPTGYSNHVCAVLVAVELRQWFHSADKR